MLLTRIWERLILKGKSRVHRKWSSNRLVKLNNFYVNKSLQSQSLPYLCQKTVSNSRRDCNRYISLSCLRFLQYFMCKNNSWIYYFLFYLLKNSTFMLFICVTLHFKEVLISSWAWEWEYLVDHFYYLLIDTTTINFQNIVTQRSSINRHLLS